MIVAAVLVVVLLLWWWMRRGKKPSDDATVLPVEEETPGPLTLEMNVDESAPIEWEGKEIKEE
jgi:hypothetical protein